jgi:hypothetical protein
MRKLRNATRSPDRHRAGLVWLPDVAAFRPNRAAIRSTPILWSTRAVIATRTQWGRAIALLLTGNTEHPQQEA